VIARDAAGDGVLPARARVDRARAAAGGGGQPRLVPHHVVAAAVGVVEVAGVVVAVGGERDVAGRGPPPAVLQLGAADPGHVRARGRPADGRDRVRRVVLLLLRGAGRSVVAGGGEHGVALGDRLLIDGVEARGLVGRGAAEALLGHAEGLR